MKNPNEENFTKGLTIITKPDMSFNFNIGHNGIIGKLYIKDGLLHFEGDASESATVFIEHVLNKYNSKNQ